MKRTTANMKAASHTAGTARMGIHRDSYALFTPHAGRTPRRGKVVTTVDPARVAAAFASKRDAEHANHYNPVILPNSKTIQR